MKFKLIVLTVLLIPCFLFSQTEKKFDPDKLGLNVLAGISTFTFDGQIKIFEAPFAGGIQYVSQQKKIDIGLYLCPVIDEGGDQSKSRLAIMPFTNIFQKLGFGIGYSFFKGGKGFVKPDKSTLFLSLNLSLLQ